MGNITVGRYDNPADVGYQGWIEPDDRSWIMFVSNDGSPVAFLPRSRDRRSAVTGWPLRDEQRASAYGTSSPRCHSACR